MRRLLTLLAALPLLGAASPASQPPQPAPNPVETAAWLKIFGLTSGSPVPVVLSEAEVNALLGSAQLAALFTDRAGLTDVEVRLLPDEVHLSGRMENAMLGDALGPFAPPAGSPPQPVELAVRLRDAGGSGEVTLLRGAVSGMELPPQFIAEAVLAALAGVVEAVPEGGAGPILDGAPFPLPRGVARFEVRLGEIVLTPASP